MNSSIYDVPKEYVVYYDREIRDCHYCTICNDIIPLSRKGIGLCEYHEQLHNENK